jgi:hypothetical protein
MMKWIPGALVALLASIPAYAAVREAQKGRRPACSEASRS